MLKGTSLEGKQLVWIFKKTASWFGGPKFALGSKVAHFFVFFSFSLFSFTLLFKLCDNGKHYRDWTLLITHHLPHFSIKLELTQG
jgi:hypothetical protein